MEQFVQMILSMAAGALGGLVVALVYVLMEAAKGFIPGFSNASKARKRSVAIVLGGLIGTALAFIPEVGLAWYIGLIVGLLAGAGTAAVRMMGKEGPARKVGKKGFARLTTMILAALFGIFMLGTMTGCAHLDPAEQEAVEASMTCSIELLTAAKTCLPECLAIEDPATEKQCVIDCTLETAEDVLPTCAQVYGDIHSDALGVAVRDAVEAAFAIYHAVKK